MSIPETESAYKPIIYGQQTPNVSGQKEPSTTIFTSNILNESDYKKIIPPELQTRFDLVCEFEEPSEKDKSEYLRFLLDRAESLYIGLDQLKEEEKWSLCSMDNYASLSFREIKKEFSNRLMNLLSPNE